MSKIGISISIKKDLHAFLTKLSKKEIIIDQETINLDRSISETYEKALEYALENINEWVK